MLRASFAACLVLIVAANSFAAEPPAADPLLQALEQMQRETAALREQLGKPAPGRNVSPSASPGMSAPAAMGRPATTAPAPPVDVRLAPPAATTSHWSFQPLRRPPVPNVVDRGGSSGNAVDAFIEARLLAENVEPGPEADAAALCRRIYFDLTGLPPTPEELADFVSDSDDDAYATLVDKLLASPRFGERWARHWLDVVRYADSIGRSWNAPFTYAWRYRDYVIDSLNADVPYDRFIAEQLAGDLLTSDDPDERRARLTGLGFLGLGSLDLRGGDGSFQLDQIDDQIDVTTRAFLGITVACARCHDHKYDPIAMRDYYALAGIFLSTDTLPGQADRRYLGANGYVDPDRLVRLPDARAAVGPTPLDDVAGPVVHSMSDYQRAWSTNRNVRYTTDPNLAMGAAEGEVQDCELRLRGEPYDLGPSVPRGELQIPSLPRLPPIPSGVSGRLELARWIGSRDNPLTARVMANRVWSHLFGRGLVPTIDDFGATGDAPTHPELLDWIAVRFIDDGWSVKQLIRTIVLSRTYRRASSADTAATAVDPDNALYWRQNLRSLELEPLRDAMLHVAGRLHDERPYGIQVTGVGGKTGNRSLLGFDAPYRTIYLPVMRGHVPDVYATFDFPDPTQIQGRRDSTTVAPQALFFMNDRFTVDCARSTAERLLDSATVGDAGRICEAYALLFGRPPQAAETAAAMQFMAELQAEDVRDAETYRWTALVQAMLSSAEFRFVK